LYFQQMKAAWSL